MVTQEPEAKFRDDYEIIDCHYHLSRDISQEKAFHRAFSGKPHIRERDMVGTPERMVPYMARVGISKVVMVCNYPTREIIAANVKRISPSLSKKERDEAKEQILKSIPERTRRYNQWACSVHRQYPQLIPFISIQPILGRDGMVEELEASVREGAKGVKMHPNMNGFSPKARILWPFYERCQELGIPILPDSGASSNRPIGLEYGRPINFAPMLRAFPRLTVIMAHLGSAYWDERVEMAKQFPNLCFDISGGGDFYSSRGGRGASAADAPRIMRKIGVERIVFGSDGPGRDIIDCADGVLGFDLTDKEKRMIMAENAKRLIKI